MDLALLERLKKITDEEQRLLDGGSLDMNEYAEGTKAVLEAEKLIESGKLIAIRPNTRFAAFPKHRHNYVEMVYMCSGEQTHIINDGVVVNLCAGELLLLNQHAFHQTKITGYDDIAVNFIVLPAFFESVIEMIGSENKLSEFIVEGLVGDGRNISYMHFNVADVLPVQNLLENLIWSIVSREPNRRNINQFTMGLLFLQLLNYTDRLISNEPQKLTNTIVMSALREIEENYMNASLSRVARQCNVTAAYVSRIVKEYCGKTFKELLMEKRLSRASALLIKTTLTIADIVLLVGYENTSYFYKIFTAKYGMSPKKWRNMQVK